MFFDWQVPAGGRPYSAKTRGQAEAVQGTGIDFHIGIGGIDIDDDIF